MYLQNLCKRVIIYKSRENPCICVLPFEIANNNEIHIQNGEVNYDGKK